MTVAPGYQVGLEPTHLTPGQASYRLYERGWQIKQLRESDKKILRDFLAGSAPYQIHVAGLSIGVMTNTVLASEE